MHLPRERGRGGVWGPDCQVSGLQTKGVGVTNVPWDHLSGPQTYINDVNVGRFRLLWGNTMEVVAFYLKTFSYNIEIRLSLFLMSCEP